MKKMPVLITFITDNHTRVHPGFH